MGKLDLDPDSAAAMEMRRVERLQEETAILEQKKREKIIGEIYRMMGRIEAMEFIKKTGAVASLIWLKQVKENKLYREVPEIGSWEIFCEKIGLSRRKVDEDIQNLKIFGEEFLAAAASFSVGYTDLRRLRYAAQNGEMIIDAEAVTIGEDKIPLTPEHAEDLEAAIQGLLDAKQKQIDEQQITLKAKDRIIKGKDEVINKQEGEIARHERECKERSFAPGEEAFLKQLANIRLLMDEYLDEIDPNEINLRDATPRMVATYIELIGTISRWATSMHDTARFNFGHPEVDGQWTPSLLADSGRSPCDPCKESNPTACDNKCCNLCLNPCNLKKICKFTTIKG